MQSGPDSHAAWMSRTIDWTRRAGKTPFGCILVDRQEHRIVSSGLNNRQASPVLHAEMVALQQYAAEGSGDWQRITLYSTAEPCPMCQSAILWCGIPETIFGTSIESLMRIGFRQIEISAEEVVRRSWAADATVTGGLLEVECDALFEQHRRPL